MVLSKVILVQGISSTVFLLYQFTLATLFMSSLAFFFERVTLAQSMLSGALYFTTSTVEAAVLNTIPAITYVLSLLSRQEDLNFHTPWGKLKVLGTAISVFGALTLVLWRHGSPVSPDVLRVTPNEYRDSTVVGLVMVVVGVISFSTWILMLEPTMKMYPAEISMTAIMFGCATLQTGVMAAFLCRRASLWQLNWDMELLNIFIGGALNSGLANLFVAWCAGLKGPVFTAAFSPLGLIFTTLLETVFLHHHMYCESVIGSILIVTGLYIYLWSKSKEEEDLENYKLMNRQDLISSPLILPNIQSTQV
ncbi:WAT1-related protein [Acorus gramineus]|uniref:WAT1-related protein n=1 Tax=Acorus gramineus TaxID=55184 RepID=A0AAV9AS81_ACOGR|nr:WAT1-related protein [Acorus gramineus]